MRIHLVAIVCFVFCASHDMLAQSYKAVHENDFQFHLYEMIHAVKSLKTARFELISRERIDGELIWHKAFAKIQYQPKKIFIRSFDEQNVLKNEVLFVAGSNNENALISPNGFPYINLNLDPLGNTMRNNRQLTLLEAGGVYLAEMLDKGFQRELKNGTENKMTIQKSSEALYGEVYVLKIENVDYGVIQQKVGENESLRSFCYRLGIPAYKVILLNDDLSDFNDDVAGKTLTIPNYYAKNFELVIRLSDHMPMKVRIFDDSGLYAEYVYTYFEVNPKFEKNVFNKDNPAYTF